MIGVATSLAAALAISAPQADDAPPKSSIVLEVPATHRLIEGIATDGETIWLSSVVDRRILVWRGAKMVRVLKMPRGTARPLGLAFDASRDWIWIATDCPRIVASDPCSGSALIAIDRRGRLKANLRLAGADPHFGDVSVDQGTVHVSDSMNGAVYACRGDCRALDVVVPVGVGRSAQSTVRYDDGRRLLVADYSAGIASVDATGVRTPIVREDGRPLRGVDGLVGAGDWMIGIQNSQSPGVVLAFRLAADGQHMAALHVLAGGPDYPDPTQLAVSGNRLLIVADAQWAAYDAAKPDGRPAQHVTRILSVPIPK